MCCTEFSGQELLQFPVGFSISRGSVERDFECSISHSSPDFSYGRPGDDLDLETYCTLFAAQLFAIFRHFINFFLTCLLN